jgi:hypothetical protein
MRLAVRDGCKKRTSEAVETGNHPKFDDWGLDTAH